MIAAEPTALQETPEPQARVQPGTVATLVKAWGIEHPLLVLVLVSAVAVILNCYPVIFCGRSFVSPACVPSLVYDHWPPMPEMASTTARSLDHGSDVYAMMWWGVPMGFLESRSLLEHGELPLWNRYGHAGAPLLGQGLSMLGDPLHLIVIAGRGSAAAWDLKFLVAKFVFCLGFGLLILKLLHNKPLSWIYAALGAYCGAFFFIANHPVFFVFAYAPWILLSAMEFLELRRPERYVRWGLIWLVANFGCFNAGHLEVAVDLIAGLNLAALADALVRGRNNGLSLMVLGRMTAATLLFLGLTAPVWVSFLVLLSGSYTSHEVIQVVQQPLGSLPGAFDESFFRDVWPVAPGTSLLVLAGVVLSALNWRQFKAQSFFWVNTTAVVLWGGSVFGWIPGSLFTTIPLLNRVGHLASDLSYLLVIHLTIQSAYGFKSLVNEDSLPLKVNGAALAILMFGLFLYFFRLPYPTSRLYYFIGAGLAGIGAPLLFAYLRHRYTSIPVLGYAGVVCLAFIAQHRFGLYTFGNRVSYMVPGPRAALDARSQAIDKLTQGKSDPFRIVACSRTLGGALSGDYSCVYGLEDIRSCAPVSNGDYIDLIRHFPGVTLQRDWIIKVTDPIAAQPLLSLLNVKYLLRSPAGAEPVWPGFRIMDRSDFLVLQNTQTWPRAFFVNQVAQASSTEQFIKQLKERTSPFVSVTRQMVQTHSELRRLEEAKVPILSPATDYHLLPNSTAFHVHAGEAGLVCLTEGQAKDFTVTVNRQAREVLTVNRAFKGVYLDAPGDYDIQFTYRPRYWRSSCALFWASLAGVIALAGRTAFRGTTHFTLENSQPP